MSSIVLGMTLTRDYSLSQDQEMTYVTKLVVIYLVIPINRVRARQRPWIKRKFDFKSSQKSVTR